MNYNGRVGFLCGCTPWLLGSDPLEYIGGYHTVSYESVVLSDFQSLVSKPSDKDVDEKFSLYSIPVTYSGWFLWLHIKRLRPQPVALKR